MQTAVSLCLIVGSFAGMCVSLAAWLIPVDVMTVRAYNQAPDEPFAQFEAVGRAEALWWSLRVTAVLGTGLMMSVWRRRFDAERFMRGLIDDVRRFAVSNDRIATAGDTLPRSRRLRNWLRAGCVAAFLILACFHQVDAISHRASDWPYYHLSDGDEILPNISDSNRAVIRYLRSATPEDSCIFIVSDQKLFFVSYYLLPRRVLHRMHPEAEHLIPRKNQERQLSAYRLSEIPTALLKAQRPDYIFEYFEGAEYVEPGRATEDAAWLQFVRSWVRDPNYIPPYTVVLRPWSEDAQ